MDQRAIEWNPPASPLPSLADSSVHPDDEAPLKESALRMYERLLEGPATNRELEDAGAGERIAARRLDLNVWFRRRGMPWFIPRGKRQATRGVTLYWLVSTSNVAPRQ
jgi:hypothetical protein